MVAVQEQAIYDYRSAGKTNGCRKKITGPIQYVRIRSGDFRLPLFRNSIPSAWPPYL